MREYLHDKTIHYGGEHIGGGRSVERERLRAADDDLGRSKNGQGQSQLRGGIEHGKEFAEGIHRP